MWGLFWAFVIGFAVYDGTRDWANTGALNYQFRGFLRVAFIILISFWDYEFSANYAAGAFKLACYRFSWFWIVFDILVNSVHFRNRLIRGHLQYIFHLGRSAFLDAIFRIVWGAYIPPKRSDKPEDWTQFQEAQYQMQLDRYNRNTIGATITQYVVKILALIITYQWYNYSSDTFLF